MSLRRLTLICFLTIFAICGIALTPNEAISKISGFLAGASTTTTTPGTPTVTSITPSVPAGTYTSGSISFVVAFSAPVTSTGTITLPLNTTPTMGVAACVNASNVTTLTCTWSIGTNQSANQLGTTAAGLAIAGGSIVATTGGAPANLTNAQNYTFAGIIINPTGTPTVVTAVSITPNSGLFTVSGAVGAGNTAVVTVNFSGPESVVTSGGTPTITLSTGTVCPYSGGAPGTNLTFNCTFISGQNTPLNTWQVRLTTLASGAIQLNGGQIANGGVPATLSGADGLPFRNAQVDTTTPLYFGSPTGSGTTCSWAAPCKSLVALQTKAQSVLGHIWLTGTTTNYGSGLATTNFTSHNGFTSGIAAYVLMSALDNGEVWAGYPGQTPTIDGGCPASAGNSPNPGISGCVFAAFASGSNGCGAPTCTTNVSFPGGITYQHFYGATHYDYQPINMMIVNETYQHIYNTSGFANGGDSAGNNGAEGVTFANGYWTNYVVSHNAMSDIAGLGISVVSGEPGTPPGNLGYNMKLTFDSNTVTGCTGNASLGTAVDCGCIYGGWYPGNNLAGNPVGTSNITNNIVNVCGDGAHGDAAIYLDNIATGFLVSGNIIAGLYTNAFEINDAGAANSITNNVVDITQMAPYGNGRLGSTSTPFYMPNGALQLAGPAITQTPATIWSKNIVYNGQNGSSDGPPNYVGTIQVNAGQPGAPNLQVNWYRTQFGSYASGYPWGNFGSPTGILNSSGVLLSSSPFVNAGLQTPAGYQLVAGSVPGAGGFVNVATNQGPQQLQ